MICRVILSYLQRCSDYDLYLSRATVKPYGAGKTSLPYSKANPKEMEKLINRRKFKENLIHQIENLAKKHGVEVKEFEPTVGFWEEPGDDGEVRETSEPSMRVRVDRADEGFIEDFKHRFNQWAVLDVEVGADPGDQRKFTIYLGEGDFSEGKSLVGKFKITDATYFKSSNSMVVYYKMGSEDAAKVSALREYSRKNSIKFEDA